VREVRERVPGITVLVHPECTHEVVEAADLVGSTEFIIRTLEAAPAGSAWAIGPSSTWCGGWRRSTRTRRSFPGEDGLLLLDDGPHRPAALVWTLESLVDGVVRTDHVES
jgi:quinolinate synthase